ncbi:hypothetical protein ACSX1A_12140 [Pontibacter sp. MBLB2868]|uniref:hypothetical protein n=1 Tax=Pontibacter sp. MBLB2868 TaxID=3451555 RepID=UPI003F74F0A0
MAANPNTSRAASVQEAALFGIYTPTNHHQQQNEMTSAGAIHPGNSPSQATAKG